MVDAPPPLVRPVEGPVASSFRYDPAVPFRRGQRRVLRLRARPGAPLAAPCAGPVTFSGRTPRARTIVVRCGRWSVTVSGVAHGGAARGRTVRAGERVGTATGRIALGVRRAADPFGYVDPAPLLREPTSPRRFVPLGPAPRGGRRTPAPAPARRPVAPAARPVAPAARPVAPALRPVAPASGPVVPLGPAPGPRPDSPGRPSPAPGATPEPRPRPPLSAAERGPGAPSLPLPAWIGLALAALGLPGAAVRRRVAVRRRTAAETSTHGVR